MRILVLNCKLSEPIPVCFEENFICRATKDDKIKKVLTESNSGLTFDQTDKVLEVDIMVLNVSLS